ncbi:GMC family oxidoreductase, partial [Thioclava sp. BHET1]
YGQQIAPCNYCGFCSKYPCLNYSKASPQTTILDALKRHENFSYENNAEVTKVEMYPDGKTARGVTYVDENGQEVFQPAKIVLLCSFAFYNVRMMLFSGVGTPYDPITGKGVVGRNYAFLSNGGINLWFKDKEFNPFATAGATGEMFNDVSPRPGFTDGIKYGFIGGAKIHSSQSNGNPIGTALPPGTPSWGEGWRKGMKEWYGHHMKLSITTSCMSYRDNYIDLDPTYKDHLGNPLARITFNWKKNELNFQQYLKMTVGKIADELGGDYRKEGFLSPDAQYDLRPYVSTHNVGGAVSGNDPSTSAVNKYLQSWDAHNVFVCGGNAFPHNFQSNPTDMIGALCYYAADAIVNQYIKAPGPLVQA